MATSTFQYLSDMMALVERVRPRSILDIGVGNGRWGLLCREFLDRTAGEAEAGSARGRVVGIEAQHNHWSIRGKSPYDKIWVGGVEGLLPVAGDFDLAIAEGILQRVSKEDGLRLVGRILERCKGLALLLSAEEEQAGLWQVEDFAQFRAEAVAANLFYLQEALPNYWPYAHREGVWEQRPAFEFTHPHALLSSVPGSLLSFDEAAGHVTLRMMTFRWGGMAQVCLNGELVEEVDLYSPEAGRRQVDVDLGDRPGKLTLQLISRRHAESEGNELWFDAAEFHP